MKIKLKITYPSKYKYVNFFFEIRSLRSNNQISEINYLVVFTSLCNKSQEFTNRDLRKIT